MKSSLADGSMGGAVSTNFQLLQLRGIWKLSRLDWSSCFTLGYCFFFPFWMGLHSFPKKI